MMKNKELLKVIKKIQLLNLLIKGTHTSRKRAELRRQLNRLNKTHWDDITEYYLLGG